MAASEWLNSPQVHAWVPLSQAVMVALACALATAVFVDGPRWLLLTLATPVVTLALLGGAWVICSAPAARRKYRAVEADAAAFLAELSADLHARRPQPRPRRPRPDEDL